MSEKNRLMYYLLAFRMQLKLGVIIIDMLITFPGMLSLGRMHSFKIIPSYICYKEIFLLPLRTVIYSK